MAIEAQTQTNDENILIIGGGPAGLTAAYELTKAGKRAVVLEQGTRVGGISRTEEYKGYRFDIGGHRFYTKVTEVEDLWYEVMGDDFQVRPRLSRIRYDGKFFSYPLDFMDTFKKLGAYESFLSFVSYLRSNMFPHHPEETFEHWVTNRFGRRIFDKFFRSYTEKVWGIPVSEIRADWAAQRIKDLSFKTAVVNAIRRPQGTEIKSLINQFDYPPLGPGMMWERFAERVEQGGGEVQMQKRATELRREGNRVTHVSVTDINRNKETVEVDEVISSMPLHKLIQSITPAPPQAVLDAADRLKYRDFMVVCLIIDQTELFPDNWIYIHEPEVKVGRIQNFKNWSMDMVADPSMTSLGMEYFCNEGDEFWNKDDDDLIAIATKEVGKLGLADSSKVIDGCVIRQLKAYPVYDHEYQINIDILQDYLSGIENLQTVGRNGLHRYNNQDHSMLTAMLAARNLLGEKHDVWAVNTERSYSESFVVDENEEKVETENRPIRAVVGSWLTQFTG